MAKQTLHLAAIGHCGKDDCIIGFCEAQDVPMADDILEYVKLTAREYRTREAWSEKTEKGIIARPRYLAVKTVTYKLVRQK